MAKIDGQDYTPRLSRLLSKEKYNSKQNADASYRVLYYGGAAGSVPFLWESQPGTPKNTFNDDPLPPLTPPPSYCSSPRTTLLRKKNSKSSKILNSIFQRVPSKKINTSPPSFSPTPSASSSYSVPSTPITARKNKFKHGCEDEYEVGINSPTSPLRSGPKNGSPARRFRGYYYPIKSVKKVVLSIVGHGHRN
ncbi:hypothetical protein CDL12_26229 [Handroanthus impetiginosus]|uniref:Uncharacterized protein n=1 Tax=Handroanthus impetiginosus TaxID=429701 RepID=A0A2G9G7I9_9LAMI|nr:hypothetical protein CDL12_26229 [Handroanthus impetiginosus]